MNDITDKEMDKIVETLVLAVKVVSPDITDEGAKNLLKNVGIYLLKK